MNKRDADIQEVNEELSPQSGIVLLVVVELVVVAVVLYHVVVTSVVVLQYGKVVGLHVVL